MPFLCNKEIEETGVEVNYWHEAELVYNMKTGIVVFTVEGFVNEEAYNEGKKPVVSKFYEIPEGTQPELAAAGKAFLINYVKNLPEFEGAV
jgi:hypothetical protein